MYLDSVCALLPCIHAAICFFYLSVHRSISTSFLTVFHSIANHSLLMYFYVSFCFYTVAVQPYPFVHTSISRGWMPKSGIAGSKHMHVKKVLVERRPKMAE